MTCRKKSLRNAVFYGWIIAVAGMLFMMADYGIINNCYSLFIVPITRDLGLSRQAYSVCQTLVFGSVMCMSTIAGRIFERFGLMRVMRVGAVAAVLAYYGYSFATSLPVFYALSVLLGCSQCLISVIPLSILLKNWFHDHYGAAVGVTFLGSGLGGMIFNPIATRMIEAYDWRLTYKILAIAMAALSLPAVFLIFKERPEDMGLLPLGYDKNAKDCAMPAQKETGAGYRAALHSAKFWIFCVIIAAYAISASTLVYSISPHLQDIGYSSMFAATCVSVGMGFLAIGKASVGFIIDKIGIRKSTIFAVFSTFIGLIGMMLVANINMFALVLVGLTFGCSYSTVGIPVLVQKVFGTKEYSHIFGTFMAMSSFGSAISPYFSGTIFDVLGSYQTAFVITAAASFCVLAAYYFLIPKDLDKHFL